ncbi:MAG TPA: hypothetical protein VGI39_19060 [Polyangiaceae bacterium]|jgi:hypothetical protein
MKVKSSVKAGLSGSGLAGSSDGGGNCGSPPCVPPILPPGPNSWAKG